MSTTGHEHYAFPNLDTRGEQVEFWQGGCHSGNPLRLYSKRAEGPGSKPSHSRRLPGGACAGDPAHNLYLPRVTIRSKSEFPHMP
jgi:hypothetical protein